MAQCLSWQVSPSSRDSSPAQLWCSSTMWTFPFRVRPQHPVPGWIFGNPWICSSTRDHRDTVLHAIFALEARRWVTTWWLYRIPFLDSLCTEVNQPEIYYLQSYFNQQNVLTPLLVLKIRCFIYLVELLFLICYETLENNKWKCIKRNRK